MSTNTYLKMLTSRDLLFYKDAIKGEIAYEIDSNSYYIYDGGVWEKLQFDNNKQMKHGTNKQMKHSTICPRCGAPCSPYQEKCDYCDSYFEF